MPSPRFGSSATWPYPVADPVPPERPLIAVADDIFVGGNDDDPIDMIMEKSTAMINARLSHSYDPVWNCSCIVKIKHLD